jgi:exopolyphosphatase / guanosine-5'-triphosphate,3'-diphosphate pyrophosphatase
VARCTGGHPLVIRNDPVDARGEPFPTRYWLTCPEAVKAVARLESQGWIARLNESVEQDPALGAALAAAHRAYAKERDALVPGGARAPEGGVGGTREGVKCLHAHYAYHLAGGVDPIGAWVAPRVEPVHAEAPGGRIAAIDQGTNSIRLLVAEPLPGGGIGELARDMVITRLGKDVDRTGRLDPAALERTVGVLAGFCRRARALGAERIRVAATSAVRDASNRAEFEAAVRDLAGSELEVISGEREAGLSFLGATWRLDEAPGVGGEAAAAPPPYWVLDIGGGSTEFVVGTERPEAAISVQMGSVRLTERHIRSDPPAQAELGAMRADIESALEEVEAAHVPVRDASTLVAVAGTATTLQAMALDLPRYDPERIHRSWLTLEDAERVRDLLARMTGAQRAALPFMPTGRADVIVAGAVILESSMARFGFERALVSESDILDGLAIELVSGL